MTKRKPAAAMGVTAAILAAWMAAEGFSSAPIIPTKGDVPTIGHGSTHYEDGRRVNMADPPITRQRAQELAYNLLDQTYAACVRRSLGNSLVLPEEFAIAVDFAGQYGCSRWANSSMRKQTQAGQYLAACHSYRLYKFSAGYDCSTPGNKVCGGVWARSLKREADCLKVQP